MVCGSIANDTNLILKELCSPVAAITGPWNCVVYRNIHLLKAHLCSHSFSSKCMGDAAPKHFSHCGFVLLYVIPLREALSAQYIYLVLCYRNPQA